MKGPFRMGFDKWAAVLFALVMLPNILWAAMPMPNDVLRMPSQTPVLDGVASFAQVVMIAALCMVINTGAAPVRIGLLNAAAIACCAGYYAMWGAYACGVRAPWMLVGMCAVPAAAFVCYAADRRNPFALGAAVVFAVCHTAFGLFQFVL